MALAISLTIQPIFKPRAAFNGIVHEFSENFGKFYAEISDVCQMPGQIIDFGRSAVVGFARQNNGIRQKYIRSNGTDLT